MIRFKPRLNIKGFLLAGAISTILWALAYQFPPVPCGSGLLVLKCHFCNYLPIALATFFTWCFLNLPINLLTDWTFYAFTDDSIIFRSPIRLARRTILFNEIKSIEMISTQCATKLYVAAIKAARATAQPVGSLEITAGKRQMKDITIWLSDTVPVSFTNPDKSRGLNYPPEKGRRRSYILITRRDDRRHLLSPVDIDGFLKEALKRMPQGNCM